MKLAPDVVHEMQVLWAGQSERVKRLGRLLIIDGEPIENTSARTCSLNDEDGCKTTIKVLKGVKKGTVPLELVWETKVHTIWQPIEKTNDWWGRRNDDEREVVDSHYIEELDEESMMARYRKFQGGNPSDYRPFMDGMQIQYEDHPRPCITKVGDTWLPCKFHPGYARVKYVLAHYKDPKEIAELILWFFVRPEKREQPVPNAFWTLNDWRRYKVLIWDDIKRQIDQQIAPDVAQRRSWGKFTGEHPELDDYKKWMRNVALPESTVSHLRRDAQTILKRNGIDVSLPESLRAYRRIVAKRKYGFGPNLHTGRCPMTLTVPEGKHASRIICQTATKQKGVIPDYDNGSWVRYHEADMPSFEFNKLPLSERKELLGCKCESCIQERVFTLKGDRFVVNSEALVLGELFQVALPFLVEQQEQGQAAITGEDEDLLFENLYNLTIDSDELPSVVEDDYIAHERHPGVTRLLDPNDIESDWEDRLYAQQDPWTNVNLDSLEDKMHKSLCEYAETSPGIIYHKTKAQMEAEYKKYLKGRIKEAKERNKPAERWLREWRKIPWPEPKKKPTLNDPADRQIVRDQLDAKLHKQLQERKAEHLAWVKIKKERDGYDDAI